jgi:hypothetical protein
MMTKVKKIVIFPVATLAIAGIMISCSGLNGTVSDVEAGKAKAFQVSGLSINPTEVAARDEVVITALVTNVTAVDDEYNAELKINNTTEASEKVLVPAGKTQTLTFAIFRDRPGTYNVALGSLKGRFSVVEQLAAASGNQPPPVSLQGGASCCGGTQGTSVPQAGPSCCGTPIQNNTTYAPRSGCGCGR